MYINNIYNNPLKVYFSSKKYLITIQTRPTQIVISIFLIEKPVCNRFLKIISLQNQLPITFYSDILYNKTLKARKFEYLISLLHIKSEQKVRRKKSL